MELTDYRKLIRVLVERVSKLSREGTDITEELQDVYGLLYNLRLEYNIDEDAELREYALKVSKFVHQTAMTLAARTGKEEYDQTYWDCLHYEAPYVFESYMLYMEKNRAPKKKFYVPRRKPLKTLVDELQALEDGKYSFLGISLPPRVGKALAYETPVLTRNGWKQHGDLTIRDEVIGPDGEYKRVLAIHNPCEMQYEVVFADGEKIKCHGNHEWTLYDRHSHSVVTIETKTLAANGIFEKDGRNRFFAPEKAPVIGSVKDLAVDPYALGAWLGDGRNTNPDLCGAESDYAIVQKILDNGYVLAWDTKHKTTGVRYYGFKGLREQLQTYGMCHSRRRTEKHIPDEYYTASIEQRLALLAGLLDTDGSLRKEEHRYSFTTNEPRLRDNFIALVSTFGWRTCVARYESGMSSSGIYANKPYWVVSFNPTMHIPCQLERKQLFEFSKPRKIALVEVTALERGSSFGNCITVEGGVYCVGKTLKPTHNSTLCIFFLSWIMGRRPNSHSAMSGHSGILADGFYSEILNLIETKEYTFQEIFPDAMLQRKSAEKKEINLGDPDRFSTLTCRGIDGTWTGAVDISSDGYLYVDDLVRDRTESLSPVRLENRYQDYLNVLVDRKNDGARELMVGTRWNVLDPLGRVEAEKRQDPGYKFIKIPALDRYNESNFNYKHRKGFSTKYYLDLKSRLDANEWEAKYQQKPFVREGLLFPVDELRYYNGVLPDGDCRIVSACDVAWGGGDSLSMPVGAEYENGDVYIFDWVFNKGKKEETLPLVVGRIMNNEIRQIRFEGNTGGELYGKYVDERLREHGYKCSCTDRKAPTRMSKVEKIIAYSGDIKRKFIFLDEEHWSPEYRAAMEELTMFVTIGKNAFDDAPDGLTQLAMFIDNDGLVQTSIIRSPF